MKLKKLLGKKWISILAIITLSILSILSISFLVWKLIGKFSNIEKFDIPDTNVNTIVSNWDNVSGFYSELGFKLNHYLYCKKYKINFTTPAINWQYTFDKGWTDYFEDVKLSYHPDTKETKTLNGCCTILEQFPLEDYINIIPEYYRYNPKTKSHIDKVKQDLGLINKRYGAVYIRRGDKLVDEIKIVPSVNFAKMLLEKMSDCKYIFVQTDDYTCYIDIKNYVENELKNSEIKVLTICPENVFGAISNKDWSDKMINGNVTDGNKSYVDDIKKNNKLSKPISEMSKEEKYAHTMELLSGVDICLNADVVICDYKSNVSRFIKLAHPNFDKVFDVNGAKVSKSDKLCPAYDFNNQQ